MRYNVRANHNYKNSYITFRLSILFIPLEFTEIDSYMYASSDDKTMLSRILLYHNMINLYWYNSILLYFILVYGLIKRKTKLLIKNDNVVYSFTSYNIEDYVKGKITKDQLLRLSLIK